MESFIDYIISAVRRMEVVGEKPDSMIVPASMFRLRRIKGGFKERKRLRFYNRQRIAAFAASGISITSFR